MDSNFPDGLPGNWFIEGDGTCGEHTNFSLSSQGAFLGFFFLALIASALAGGLNFVSLLPQTRQARLFKHGVYKQTIIDFIASLITPVLAATLFKQDDDTYTRHNFHVVAWAVLFGFRPGAMMGVMQIFGQPIMSAAAAGQMIADMIFPLVGCVVALGSENGSVVPVAYGQHRITLFIGVTFLLLHLVMLVVSYLVYLLNNNKANDESRYKLFTCRMGQIYVLFLGLFSITGSSVLLLVGSKMCGKLTTFIDAMCQVLQAVLSAILAFIEANR